MPLDENENKEEQYNLEFPVIDNFSPEVPVEIYGEIKDNVKVVAVVDTGSTGFLQVPITVGMKANLHLLGFRTYVMADGRKVKQIECIGKVRFANKDVFGIVTLSETSDDCLLGMQFLEKLGMDFTVSTKNKKAIFSLPDNNRENTKEQPKPVLEPDNNGSDKQM